MASKKGKRRHIPVVQEQAKQGNIPGFPPRLLKDDIDANTLNPKISFQYYDASTECIRVWDASESKQLFERLKYLSDMTWREVLSSGGRSGGKTGLGWTKISREGMKRTWPANLSEDVSMCEIRICRRKRVFGVRDAETFYLVWLDRNHTVCPV